MGKFEIKYRKISELIPAEYNPRTLSEKQFQDLKKSFENLGTLEPAVINTFKGREGVIVSGHQRLKVAAALGMMEYPCLEVSFNPKKEKEANIRMNKNTGEWDFNVLANEFEMPDLLEWGFLEEEFGINTEEANEGLTDQDDVPEAPKEPKTKKGDIYSLGSHRLICGDSTNILDIEKLMRGNLCDCVWTDPPYGVSYVGKTKDALEIENDDISEEELEIFIRSAIGCAFSVTKDGGSFYVAAPAGTLNIIFSKVLKDFGVWRQTLNWIKSSMVLGRSDYHYKHEPIFYGWKPGASHNWYSDRKQTTCLEFDKPNRNGIHPTMKPVELVEYCISNSTKQKDNVLDIFGGSGTTLISCEKINRNAFICEIDPKYCDVIVKRWEDFTGKKAVLIAT